MSVRIQPGHGRLSRYLPARGRRAPFTGPPPRAPRAAYDASCKTHARSPPLPLTDSTQNQSAAPRVTGARSWGLHPGKGRVIREGATPS